MKKQILILLTLVSTITTFSQITKIQNTSELIGKVQHVSCSKNNDNYTITYRDYKFLQITELKSFRLSEQDFNDLFDIIAQGFIDIPKEEIKLETPNDVLYLKFSKNMGVVSLQMIHFVNKNPELAGLTRYLTKKQVLKIFGKKKK